MTQDIWSSTARPVTGIMPPENTSCDMIATTSSGMICSLDFASADSARPTVAAQTQRGGHSDEQLEGPVGDHRAALHGSRTPLLAVDVDDRDDSDCRIANTA